MELPRAGIVSVLEQFLVDRVRGVMVLQDALQNRDLVNLVATQSRQPPCARYRCRSAPERISTPRNSCAQRSIGNLGCPHERPRIRLITTTTNRPRLSVAFA